MGDTKDEVVFAALGACVWSAPSSWISWTPRSSVSWWVTEFPMFEWSEEEGRYQAMHHPFTAPMLEDEDKMLTDKANCRARAYDIVLNGTELGAAPSGSTPPRCRPRPLRPWESLTRTSRSGSATW